MARYLPSMHTIFQQQEFSLMDHDTHPQASKTAYKLINNKMYKAFVKNNIYIVVSS